MAWNGREEPSLEREGVAMSIANDLERTFADMPMVAPRKPQISRILEETSR